MLTFSPFVDGYYDTADQVAHDLRRRAEAHFRRQEKEKAGLRSVRSFEARRERVRAHFLDAIGGLPEKRTPLRAQVTGTLDRGSFLIEKIVYQSLPEFYVTAALYRPRFVAAPAPAVVFVHGHSDLGKGYANYQAVCSDLARNGFVVLAVDPLGQGERYQYFDPATRRRTVGPCTIEHTHAGLPLILQGASIARHFIWDVIRGVDYLERRPEVDAARIGLTGNSGGGTQTSLLMMSEPRFAAAVPCTFVMTLESYLKTGQPQDAEQIVRGCMVHGPDHDDFLTAMAPKPVLVGAVASDYFPIEGSIEAVRRARRVYRLYGSEKKVDIAIDASRHEYSPGLRQACVNWFLRHLMSRKPDFVTGKPEILPESELWATPAGQVLAAFPRSRTVYDLGLENLRQNSRTAHSGRRSPASLRQAVVRILGIETEKRRSPIFARTTHESVVDGCPVEKIFFFSEPDIIVTGVMIHPRSAEPPSQTDLVLLPEGTQAIPAETARLEALLRRKHRVFVFDVRGVGAVEARPVNPARNADSFDSEFKMACDAMMLGISLLGLRTFDVLRAYDYLKTRSDSGRIGLYGRGNTAVLGLLAAAIEPGFAELAFEDLLVSYRHLCETRDYNRKLYNLRTMAWGILREFDLPHLLACLPPRPTWLIRPRDAHGEPLAASEYRKEMLQAAGPLPRGWRPRRVPV
ncbi:MAG: prolyl oligopeptidase family serine peptidase [Planctomycetes bacterium]|nr:prolyl oligopeptidase family serine peptidase [Planctomycetota bacterium]